LQLYVEQVKKMMIVGDPKAPETTMGPLVSKEHLAKVTSYVHLAKELGGKIECGGVAPDFSAHPELKGGYFLLPTVISGLKFDHVPCMEEIFGPVVTVTPFDKEDEVIEWCNAVKYGLAASVWSTNVNTIHRAAAQIDVCFFFYFFDFCFVLFCFVLFCFVLISFDLICFDCFLISFLSI